MHRCTHVCTHIYTHANICTHAHPLMHRCKECKHTHTHTHAHTYDTHTLSFIFTLKKLKSFWIDLQLSVRCDENEQHIAVLYCTVCDTHLCIECSETSHSTRTLLRHKRVPISEKPKENPKCVYHPMHLVEFACLEDECKSSPLMCYICKDYGRHLKHKARLMFLLVRLQWIFKRNAVWRYCHSFRVTYN